MTEPAPAQDQPVMQWSTYAAAASLIVTSIGAMLVFAGVTDETHVGTWAALVGKLVVALGVVAPLVAHLWAARNARAQVTPVASPQTNAGEVLKTAEQWALEYGKHAAPADAPSAPVPAPAPAPEQPADQPAEAPQPVPAPEPPADAFPGPALAADPVPAGTGSLV